MACEYLNIQKQKDTIMKFQKPAILSLSILTLSCFIVACGTESRKEAEKVKILPQDKKAVENKNGNTETINEEKNTTIQKNNKIADTKCLTKVKELGLKEDIAEQLTLQLDSQKSALLFEMLEYGQQSILEDSIAKTSDKNQDVLNKMTAKTGKHLVCNLSETIQDKKSDKSVKCTLYFDSCSGKFLDWGYDSNKKIEGVAVDLSKIKSLPDNSLIFQYQTPSKDSAAASPDDKNKVMEAIITLKDQEAEDIYNSLIAKEVKKDTVTSKSADQMSCAKSEKDNKIQYSCMLRLLPSKGEILSIENKQAAVSTIGQESAK